MFVKHIESGLSLLNGDELLCSLGIQLAMVRTKVLKISPYSEHILRPDVMRRRRHRD